MYKETFYLKYSFHVILKKPHKQNTKEIIQVNHKHTS